MSKFGVYVTDIPKMFWSVYSEKPFQSCLKCKVPLVEANTFVVQKRVVGDETVFEMAMCERCREQMANEFSEETRENLTNHMNEQLLNSAEKLAAEADDDGHIVVAEITDDEVGQKMMNDSIDHCMMCEKARSECHRYSLMSLCSDDQLIAQVTPIVRTPMMMCEDCEGSMSDLVSQKTRDQWNDFVEEHFDGPPGVSLDSPSSYPIGF